MVETTLRLGPFTAEVREKAPLWAEDPAAATHWTVEVHWLGTVGTGFATREEAVEYAYRAMEVAYYAAGEAVEAID